MICRVQTISCYAFKNEKAALPYSGPIDVISALRALPAARQFLLLNIQIISATDYFRRLLSTK